MAESIWAASAFEVSPHKRANKKARVLAAGSGGSKNSSPLSPPLASPSKDGQSVTIKPQLPLLDQYREVLSNLNGRVFQQPEGSERRVAGQKENRVLGYQSESCCGNQHDDVHTIKLSQLVDEGRGRQQYISENHPSTSSLLPAFLSQPQCHYSLSPLASRRESPTNCSLHQAKPLANERTKETRVSLSVERSFVQEEEDSDDDAELLLDWRRAGGAARTEATSSQRCPIQDKASMAAGRPPEVAQCGTQAVCHNVNTDGVFCSRDKEWDHAGPLPSDWVPDLNPESPLETAPSEADSDSQEGALSQLLEMVDDAVTGTTVEGTEFLGSSEKDLETARGNHMQQPAELGPTARPLSEAERSRFISEASQTVLTDSDEQQSEEQSESEGEETLDCPVCGGDLQQMEASSRDEHTNRCLDGAGEQDGHQAGSAKAGTLAGPSADDCNRLGLDYAPLVAWLDSLQLGRYAAAFVKEEVDFDSLHCLKEEDLGAMGVVALGPKRKLLAAIEKLKGPSQNEGAPPAEPTPEGRTDEAPVRRPTVAVDRRITDFFPAPNSGGVPAAAVPTKGLITSFFTTPDGKKLPPPVPAATPTAGRGRGAFVPKKGNPPGRRGGAWKQVSPDPPEWHLVPGTDFRVDAFRFQSPHCRHWFLSHFHADHYQGLTRNFRHGPIFCSPVTARLVHMKLGVPLETLHAIPLGERTRIDNCHVTLLEANHCPGAAMMLFEPDGAKPTLHTGDFRYCPAMAHYPALQRVEIGTLILDTTYCDPQYDFPAQDDVIQFVIDAIEAETFNPKTLFLIGAYTIGKERVFLEVARALNTKIYVGAARRKVLACLDLPAADMARLTTNENESNVHVVPLWSLANFKRMNSIAKHHQGRYNTFVSFSPTGWSFGRGKRRSNGTRKQQGTIVRYEVPYSEHSSFSELRAFVRVVKPAYILPHVNNDGGQKAETMIAELLKAREPGLE